MKTIMVGVDGSPDAMDAMQWAADLAARSASELLVAHAFVPAQAELGPEAEADEHAAQSAELERWCASLPAGVTATPLMLVGEPPEALLHASVDREADLLVVAGRGTGGFLHLHLGSVAHHLTHYTRVPLAIVPRTGAVPVEHVVLGVDGSAGSLAAADFTADLATALDVGVTGVYAFEPLAIWVPADDPSSWRRKAESDVGEWAAPITRAGANLKVDIDRDIHPVAALERALEAHPNSVAVVGARGAGGFFGLRLGRVPLQLLHHSGAAVVVVPERAG